MEENTERDEVYEQFMQDMQAKKKRQVKRTIREVIMVVIILEVKKRKDGQYRNGSRLACIMFC